MNYILFDSPARHQLLPFTHTRPVADIRCGILTMRERWEHFLGQSSSTLCPTYLQACFPLVLADDNVWINGAVFANAALCNAIAQLAPNEQLVHEDLVLAFRTQHTNESISFDTLLSSIEGFKCIAYDTATLSLAHSWDIFLHNEKALCADFTLVTKDQVSQSIPDHVSSIAPENIFIAEGATVQPCIINASKGPVYIGEGAEIMEGCMLRGPIALGKNAVLKMGAKVYGGSTIGENCKVGGEVSNVVFFANSNKGHDGFIGNAVIGEWCNLGADTNCSNLKNNYDTVKVWDEHSGQLVGTGLQFCGLLMGDHSKTGINTMLNTGTVVGVSCNIYGSNFPAKFVPSFSWGSAEDFSVYRFDQAMDTARRMMARRGLSLSTEAEAVYQFIFDKGHQA